jgi:hypothetical protein
VERSADSGATHVTAPPLSNASTVTTTAAEARSRGLVLPGDAAHRTLWPSQPSHDSDSDREQSFAAGGDLSPSGQFSGLQPEHSRDEGLVATGVERDEALRCVAVCHLRCAFLGCIYCRE